MVTDTAGPVQRLQRWLLGFWIVPVLVGTLGFVLVPSRLNPGLSLAALFLAQIAIWGAWVGWTILLWRLGDRLASRGAGMAVQIIAFGVVGIVVVVAQIFWQATIASAFGWIEPRGVESTLVIGLRTNGDYFVVMYAAVVLAQLAFRWLATLQAAQVSAAQLGEDLARAQLRALRSQLHPHFLFNALNSVVTLIGRDPARAEQVVVQLSDLLRATLRSAESQEVTLSQELELTRRYLAIEQVRFADRLTVHWRVPSVPHVLVPAFALQPLVENALVHGIARSTAGGTVTIDVTFDDTSVTLQVGNTGPGLWPPSTASGAGTGLSNLRTRLERLYGDRASLRLQEGPMPALTASDAAPTGGAGVVATLRLPRSTSGAVDT